ncbi:MAG: hypothetical protein RLZZ544_515, partial [Actinomycetota bacterium]
MASGTGTSVWDNVVGHAGAVDLL